MTLPSWLTSSRDPAKISLTIKGLSAGVIGAIPLFAYFGWHPHAESIAELGDQMAVAISALFAAYGAVRKLWTPDDTTTK